MTTQITAESSAANQQLLTVAEVAERLGLSSYGVRDCIQFRVIPHVRLGTSIRVRQVGVDAYLAKYRTSGDD